MPGGLSPAAELKFALMARGLRLSGRAEAYVRAHNGERPLSPNDYATTSGVILELAGGIWTNAPVARYNPNFVGEDTPYLLEFDPQAETLVVRGGAGGDVAARMWLPPAFLGQRNSAGESYDSYGTTHGDRVRVEPITGCSMACKFCDSPFDARYLTQRVAGVVEVIAAALTDPLQPAAHVLISGGTPRPRDVGYMRSVYEAVLTRFPTTPVDIMMVPVDDLIEPGWLDGLGVHELSVNIEVWNLDLARRIMRHKYAFGRDRYLDYLERAVETLGVGRVRSMLLVGLDPVEDTLAGVAALTARGVVPVLSPFRPDPATPMRDQPPASEELCVDVYLRARGVAEAAGVPLGPSCPPCTHNTLTLPEGEGQVQWGHPRLI